MLQFDEDSMPFLIVFFTVLSYVLIFYDAASSQKSVKCSGLWFNHPVGSKILRWTSCLSTGAMMTSILADTAGRNAKTPVPLTPEKTTVIVSEQPTETLTSDLPTSETSSFPQPITEPKPLPKVSNPVTGSYCRQQLIFILGST